jgi:ribosome maturation protein SDO1
MSEVGYSVRANKTAKSQVSECIKMLQSDSTLPIERAKMRIRVIVPAADIDGLRERLLDGVDKLEREETGDEWSGTMLIDPVQFRVISDLLRKAGKGKGRVETLTFNTSATTNG